MFSRGTTVPRSEKSGRGELFGSAVDRLQAQLYGVGEELGLPTANLRRENEAEAEFGRNQYFRDNPDQPRSYDEMKVGTNMGSWLANLAVESAPATLGIIGAGLAGGAPGALAAGSVLGTGDVLENQRDQVGRGSLASAAPLGVAYGAADALLGVGGMAARKTLGTGIKSLDMLGAGRLAAMDGITGVAARTGASMGKTGLVEGAAETFQEGMNQLGRMAVDPDEEFLNERSVGNFKESFAGGAALGALFGVPGGLRRGGPAREASDAPPPRVEEQPDLLARSRPDFDLQRYGQGEGPRYQPASPYAWETPLDERIDAARDAVSAMPEGTDIDGPFNALGQLQAEQYGLTDQRMPGQGDLWMANGEPTYGADGGTPWLDTRMQPLQGRIDQNLGITRTPVADSDYAAQVDAAASEPTNQWAVNADGLEQNLDAGDYAAVRAGVPLVAANTKQAPAAAQPIADPDADLKALIADRTGIAPNKKGNYPAAVMTSAKLIVGANLDEQSDTAAWNALGQGQKHGLVKKIVYESTAQQVQPTPHTAAPAAPAAEADQVGAAPRVGTPTLAANAGAVSRDAKAVWEQLRTQNKWMPAAEELSGDQVGLVEELAQKGWLTPAAAKTVVETAPVKQKVTSRSTLGEVESDAAVEFRKNFSAALSKMPDLDRALVESWFGVAENENGELETAPIVSAATLGQGLTSGKSGAVGISREAVRKRINAILKDAGAPEGLSPRKMRERLGFQVSGADIDTMNRNMDESVEDTEESTIDNAATGESAADNAKDTDPSYEVDLERDPELLAAERLSPLSARDRLVAQIETTPAGKHAEMDWDNTKSEDAPAFGSLTPGQKYTWFNKLVDLQREGKYDDTEIKQAQQQVEREVTRARDSASEVPGTLGAANATAEQENRGDQPGVGQEWTATTVKSATPPVVTVKPRKKLLKPEQTTQPAQAVEAENVRKAQTGQQTADAGAAAARAPEATGRQETAPAPDTGASGTAARASGPADARPVSEFSDLESELAALTHTDERAGDVGVVVGGGLVRYVDFDTAVEFADRAVKNGTKAVPFQVHNATGIRLGDTNRVISALRPVTPFSNPQFSKAPASKGTDAKAMAAELRAFMRVGSLGSRVVVVQSAADLPSALRKSVGATGNTQAFVTGGKAYLIADNIAPGKARSVFLHEVGAHLGMESLLGDHYDSMVDKIVEWAGKNDGSLESKLAVRALRRVQDAGTSDAQANTELVAYFTEEAVDAGVDPTAAQGSGPLAQFMRLFRNALRAALNRLGFNTDKLTAQDFVDVAYGLARMELKLDAAPDSDTARSVAPTNAKLLAWATGVFDRRGHRVDPVAPVLPASTDVLKMLGFHRPVVINVEHARHVFNKHPSITPADLAALPSLLSRPRAVVQYGSDGVRVFVDSRDVAGNPLVVALTKTKDGRLKVTEVSTLFGKNESAAYLAQAAWNNKLLYVPKKEMARVQELLSAAPIAVKGAEAPTTSLEPGGAPFPGQNTIVLSDEALASFVENPKGKWETLTVPIGVTSDSASALRGVQFSKASTLPALPQTGNDFIDSMGIRAANLLATAKGYGQAALRNVVFTQDLIKMGTELGLKSAAAYDKLRQAMRIERGEHEVKVAAVWEKFEALPNHLKRTGTGVNQLLMDSTTRKEWAFKPSWMTPEQLSRIKYDPNSSLAKRFDALPPEAQNVVKSVFEMGVSQLEDMRSTVLKYLDSEFDAGIAAAKEAKDTAEVARLERTKLKEHKHLSNLLDERRNWPYAPLSRFGKHAVIGRSAEFMAAQDAARDNPNDEKMADKVREMEADSKHYYVSFHDSLAAAVRTKAQVERERPSLDGRVENFVRDSSDYFQGNRDMLGAMQKLRAGVEGEADAKTRAKLLSTLRDVHLQLLSDMSVRKSEMNRQTVAGADPDMMRSFAAHGRAHAHFIVALRSAKPMNDLLRTMRREARDSGGEATSLYTELLARHADMMQYSEEPLVDGIMSFTSGFMLLSNPSYFLLNATQPWMMSLPMMAGKHGFMKSATALTTAYGEVGKIVHRSGGFTRDDYASLPSDVRDAIQTMVNAGKIEISMDADMGNVRSDSNSNDAERAYTFINQTMRGTAQKVEALNRLTTAIAAYRLETEATKNTAAGVEYATKVIDDTHGDYSSDNAPRFMRHGLGRVMTQFRKFQLIQAAMYTKLLRDAFGDTAKLAKRLNVSEAKAKEAKWVAKKILMFNSSTLFAAGGLMGMPGFVLLSSLASIFGDGDEPDDPRATLTRMIGNKDWADLLLKGVPKLAGLDVSGRIGAGGMLSALPYTEIELSREGYKDVLAGALGPGIGGLGSRLWDGAGLMMSGDYWRGLATLTPGVVSGLIKTADYNLNGLRQRNGDIVLRPEEISLLNSLGVVLGVPGETITDRNFVASAKFAADEFYKKRTSQLKREYTDAYVEKDTAGMAKARAAWAETQEARKRVGMATQPLSELIKAPHERKKREDSVVGGVTTTKANRGFAEMLAQ